MFLLILAIFFATCNQLLFKAISKYKINLLCVIVANYAVCILIACTSSIGSIAQISPFDQKWFPLSILQGILFISCLFFMGKTTEKQGVAVASIATRLSVGIPTVAAFFLYKDIVTFLKITGIITSLISLYFSCNNIKSSSNSQQPYSLLPFLLFAVFGAHSLLLKFVQERYLDNSSNNVYIMYAFLSAFILSGLVLFIKIVRKQVIFRIKDLAWGLLLGFINYSAVYFLLKALSIPNWKSSQLFPTISILVVSLSSFGAWLIFKEKIGKRITGALIIGAISIILINMS